ncbi:NAD-dependent epimerase/dehydratase family protein [Thalassovita sp.]|jgi:UDP-glucuronate decarboxylase|uniref:NAD-dependent epimerase/dehydratase family protein n=1 Tax=Thalassovita sp. TaxID=1979401 RepID=UPI002AAF7DE4|nr:NAD-dependent epimerase/dehydratase family protein [Thalassovita sp.]
MVSELAGKRVLVAGGAGFVGSHLVDALIALGATPVILDNFHTGDAAFLSHLDQPEIIEHDITRPLPAGIGPVDLVYNLACPAAPKHYQADPLRTWRTSVYGTDNLAEFARAQGARMVQASTSEVYGDPLVSPQSESYTGNVSMHGIRACYDEGKRAAETLLMDMIRSYDMDIRIARIFNTYGPRMALNDGRVVPNFVRQALEGKPLTVYGHGQQTRCFCYVADTVDGLLRLGANDGLQGLVVNIGSDVEQTVYSLAEAVAALVGVPLQTQDCEMPQDDPQVRRPDLTRARDRLGWSPSTPLDSGLQQVIRYFQDDHRVKRALSV